MSEVLNAKRTLLKLKYNQQDISTELEQYLLNWTYTDNLSGEIDDLNIQLADSDLLWTGKWFPTKGSTLSPTIIRSHWLPNEVKTKLGTFEIDDIQGKGFGTTISISALAVSENSSLRGEEKSKAWEKTALKTVFSTIAKANKMKLFWQTHENPKKDRYEQDNETDLKFLHRLCKDGGLCLKIANNSIIVLDEENYEKQKPVEDIRRLSEDSDTIKVNNYSFKTSAMGTYKACRVTHRDTKKKKTITATFTVPKANKVGRTLVVKDEVKSQAEAFKLAKKKLREANKNATTFTLEVTTSMQIDAGMTFNLQGFGTLNGKYIVTKVATKPSSISLNLRRCLEEY
ncbi:MAG: contractile injection system protein, VgrG/Pvc8 family [Lysinibacillus sp.]